MSVLQASLPVPSLLRFAAVSLLLGAAAAAPALQRPSDTTAPEREARIAGGLAAIDEGDIRSDIHFLASDELGGRDTPSSGQRIAARFIRARLQRLGFEPGAPEGFFYEYPLRVNQIDEAGSHVEISVGEEKTHLTLGEDYWFSSRSIEDMDLSGPIAYCGSGKAEEIEGLALEGSWALVEEGKLSRSAVRGLRKKLQAQGAKGLLLTPGADYRGEEYSVRFERDMGRMRRGGVGWPSNREPSAEAPFATTYIASAAGATLLAQGRPAVGAKLRGATLTETRKRVGDGGRILCENVAGFWRGSDPELSKEVIIISAHYDHVGVRPDGEVFNGADDNGSGTTGLLALAQALYEHGPMRRSVLILWVSGEEKGLFGSRAWASNPWLPEGCHAVCDINIDMIGRNAPDKLLITPTAKREEYNGLVRLAEKHGPAEGFPTLGSCDSYWSRSDHAMFSQHMGIPVTFLFSDVHEDYHQVTDTPDKIDYDKIRRVARLVFRMIADLQVAEMDLNSPEFP